MEPLAQLNTYLNDHRAGAAAGTDLARHIWETNQSSEWAPVLARVAAEIRAEKDVLDGVRSAAGAAGGLLRRVGAVALEQASRVRMSAGMGESSFGRVSKLEALMSGIQAKQRLWATLRIASQFHPELDGFDFLGLERQSAEQLRSLGEVHDWAVQKAFDQPTVTP
jgi:hypothetical protein